MSNYSKYGFKNHFDVVNTARFYFKDLDALNLERDKKDRNKFSYEDYGSRKVNVTMLKDGNAEFVLENGNKEIYSVDEFANNISLGDIDGLVELKKENKKMIDSYAKGGELKAIGGKLTKSQITGKEKGKLLDVLYKAKFDAEQAGNKADVTLIEKLISKSIKGADISDSVEFKSLFNKGGRYFGYQSGGEAPETELDFHPAYSYAKGGEISLIDRVGELDDVLMSNTKAEREWDEIIENYLDGENADYWGDLGNQELEDVISEAEALIKKYKIKDPNFFTVNDLKPIAKYIKEQYGYSTTEFLEESIYNEYKKNASVNDPIYNEDGSVNSEFKNIKDYFKSKGISIGEDDDEKGGYIVFEGYDQYNNRPLYQVINRENEYVGEYYVDKKIAESEAKSLNKINHAKGGDLLPLQKKS